MCSVLRAAKFYRDFCLWVRTEKRKIRTKGKMLERLMRWSHSCLFGVPVQLEDDSPVHDGETHEANPPQEDTSEHTGIEVQDHHLQRGTAEELLWQKRLLTPRQNGKCSTAFYVFVTEGPHLTFFMTAKRKSSISSKINRHGRQIFTKIFYFHPPPPPWRQVVCSSYLYSS